MKGYVQKVLLGIDILCCMIAFRDPGVTISAETGLAMQRAKPPLWARALNGFLNLIQKDHCQHAIQHDILRAQIAMAYLEMKQS